MYFYILYPSCQSSLTLAGGCDQCKGAITIGGSPAIQRNQAYYIIAHASKFVPTGSVRIDSSSDTSPDSLPHVAFQTPAGGFVLLAGNTAGQDVTFNIAFRGAFALATIPAMSVATFVW